MKLLIIARNPSTFYPVKRALMEQRYMVDEVLDSNDGAIMASSGAYDIIVLFTISIKDEIEFCKELRMNDVNTPILIVCAKNAGVEDTVTALDVGADDYLIKPFSLAELLARVRALTRRTGSFKSLELKVRELLMNTLNMELWCNKKPIRLTRKEYVIMEYLMRHPNIAISKTRLADYAWDLESENISNVVEAYIYRLRTKLNNAGGGDLIETVRGFGYRLRDKAILTLLIIATSFVSLLVEGLPANAVG